MLHAKGRGPIVRVLLLAIIARCNHLAQADLDENNALSFDEWVRLLACNYASLLAPQEGEKIGA